MIDLFLRRNAGEILSSCVEHLGSRIAFDRASLALVDAARRRLRLVDWSAGAGAEEERSIPLGGTASAAALRSGRPVSHPGEVPSGGDAFAPLFPRRPSTSLVIPIRLGDRPLGTLNLARDADEPFDDSDARQAEKLAPFLAAALESLARYRRALESENRYRALLENSPGPVLVFNLDERRLVDVNARALDLTGYTRSELVSLDLDRNPLIADERRLAPILRRLLRRGITDFETRLRCADGKSVPVQVHATLLRVGGGRMLQCEVRDISERLREEGRRAREREVSDGLLDNPNFLICSVDRDGTIGLFNRKFEQMTGLSQAGVRGTDVAQLVPVDEQPALQTYLQEALRGEGLERYEVPLVTADGDTILVSISASVLREENGRTAELLLVGSDVTASKRFQSGLVESEKRSKWAYQQLREFSAVSSSILQEKELSRICEMFAQALREHSNYRRAILTLLDGQFRGYKWFFSGLSDDEISTFHRNRLTSDQRVTIFQEQYRLGNSYYIAHDAGWNYVGVRSTRQEVEMYDWHPDDFLFIPLYGSNRKMVGIVSVDDPRDGARPTAETISPIELFANQVAHCIEQAKLDQEVQHSTEKYRTLVDSMNDGLLAVDLTNRVTFVNPALTELLGYSEHAILSHSIHNFLNEKDRDTFRAEVRQRERRTRFELSLITRSGETIPVLVSASPFYQNGQLVGTFAIVSDLREQKKADQAKKEMHEEIVEANALLEESMSELRKTQGQLIQAEKLSAVGELISGVAHELNNPLTGVMGFSQLLLAADCDEHTKKNLAKIHREATRCQRIVQNLLDTVRCRPPEESAVQVNEILEATIDSSSYKFKVENVEIVSELATDLPVTTGDFHRLQQVFVNIINNGQQAMVEAHGRGRMVVRSERVGETIRVQFIDDGPGIPEDKVGKIFDPFYTTKEPGKGTGLGLSLSYGIISEHQGKIFVRSKVGAGTTFVIELPIRTPKEAVPQEEAPPVDESACGARILVVDDEAVILDLLESILETVGHTVDTASNGRVALEKLKSRSYDVIISDLKMPDIGGQGLWESVRAIDPALSRRMIFSTGDTVNPSTQAFFRRTGNHVLPKPFRIDEVDLAVQKVLAGMQRSSN